MLQVRNLCSPGPAAPWLRGLHADLPAGLALLTGDEGCGKTTVLRLLAGELVPRPGSVLLDGRCCLAERQACREQVFWIDPQTCAYDGLRPPDFFHAMASTRPDFDLAAAASLAEAFGLGEHVHKRIDMLSTGSRRKTWLAAAFASGARLTLLDQPMAALDRPSIRLLLALLQEQVGQSRRLWIVADHETPQGLVPDITWTLPPAQNPG